MEEKLNLRLLWKKFAGNNMKLFFGGKDTKSAEKVLILYNLVAFIENEEENIHNYLLQTREGGSSYGLDMSLRFKKPEYANYMETFLFVNQQRPDIAFRVLSEKISFYDFETLPNDDLNY